MAQESILLYNLKALNSNPQHSCENLGVQYTLVGLRELREADPWVSLAQFSQSVSVKCSETPCPERVR